MDYNIKTKITKKKIALIKRQIKTKFLKIYENMIFR